MMDTNVAFVAINDEIVLHRLIATTNGAVVKI